MKSLLILGMPIAIISPDLPLILLGVALIFLIIFNPKKFRFIAIACYTIVRGKQTNKIWADWALSYDDKSEWR